MQIDFHHAVTYVTARIAGFNHDDAEVIAYAAQYVDDATNEGFIEFDNKFMYCHIASAHKMLDYSNMDELANHHAWLPFHFLPGNGGLAAEEGNNLGIIEKIICRPNSYIAREMVRECILRQTEPWGLHRLGITMHVYADTWAHQGFVGMQDEVNRLHNLCNANNEPDNNLISWLKNLFGDKFDEAQSCLVGSVLPLGHGAALSNPDKPFLKWGYDNNKGEKIKRDNPTDFLDAADHMCKAMQCYLAGNPDSKVAGLPEKDKSKIDELLRNITSDTGDERHDVWMQAINSGKFSFDNKPISYIPKGLNSWKYQAVGTTAGMDSQDEIFPYNPSFIKSNWKMFHDALQLHRLFIINELLPRYGICAA
jgi:hypothetical protein